MKDNRSTEQIVSDFMRGPALQGLRDYHREKRRKNNIQFIKSAILPIILILGLIWYGVWFYSQPLDYQIEMRCRQGDSVACLSLPRGE